LTGTNSLARLVSSPVTKKNSFKTLTPDSLTGGGLGRLANRAEKQRDGITRIILFIDLTDIKLV